MFYFKHNEGETYLCKNNKDNEQCIQIQPQELKELQDLIQEEIQKTSAEGLSFDQLDALYWRDMGFGMDYPEE
ncbi:hypothetical protein M0R79_02795 [Ignavigranum ruoffiae]|uniref:hypothetical protein n=1 Tax=Ignavigranum ruoffiae TaxID=89093 RepID=UPI00206FD80C|nr:hypothetical protein [Ignavigranum ruoffiae]UPQ86323.1 hypothetical protein M0R79_02795 [Ignavigranum ruoffiae]